MTDTQEMSSGMKGGWKGGRRVEVEEGMGFKRGRRVVGKES